MLRHIHIRDFAIVDNLDLELEDGLTALTGETGAGKSILLDALGLCLGDRADTGALPDGVERAEIVASFDIDDNAPAREWMAEQALDGDGECIVRRMVQRSGRSQAWVNGRPAPLQSLAELGGLLVDIHGQHAHQSLMRRDTQRETLDAFGRADEALATVAEEAAAIRELERSMRELSGGQEGVDERIDLLRYQVAELEALDLDAEAIRDLDAEQRRLGSAGETLELCQRGVTALYEDEASAYSLLGGIVASLAERTDLSPDLAGAHELFSEALVNIDEGCNNLRHYADSLDVEPGRQEWVEERIATLADLARKHRCRAEELPERLHTLNGELDDLASAGDRLAAMEQQLEAALARYREAAAALSRQRTEAAERLQGQVSRLMEELGMTGGALRIVVRHDPEGRPATHGLDDVRFEVRTNPDQRFGSLSKVASGGELSRIGLALEVATAHVTRIPTLIFDEADAGIGGAVAEVVGRKLRELGAHHQVLCVTHLPQVAAQAHHQLRVSKGIDDGRTRTTIDTLAADERTQEIARMLGGMKITDNTLDHAREMLERSG